MSSRKRCLLLHSRHASPSAAMGGDPANAVLTLTSLRAAACDSDRSVLMLQDVTLKKRHLLDALLDSDVSGLTTARDMGSATTPKLSSPALAVQQVSPATPHGQPLQGHESDSGSPASPLTLLQQQLQSPQDQQSWAAAPVGSHCAPWEGRLGWHVVTEPLPAAACHRSDHLSPSSEGAPEAAESVSRSHSGARDRWSADAPCVAATWAHQRRASAETHTSQALSSPSTLASTLTPAASPARSSRGSHSPAMQGSPNPTLATTPRSGIFKHGLEVLTGSTRTPSPQHATAAAAPEAGSGSGAQGEGKGKLPLALPGWAPVLRHSTGSSPAERGRPSCSPGGLHPLLETPDEIQPATPDAEGPAPGAAAASATSVSGQASGSQLGGPRSSWSPGERSLRQPGGWGSTASSGGPTPQGPAGGGHFVNQEQEARRLSLNEPLQAASGSSENTGDNLTQGLSCGSAGTDGLGA